ncbi:response regulator, partial [bacterium]|nr:response regulator [bacterium]
NAIIGFSSLLLDTKLDHDQRDYLNIIIKNGEGLLHIINDILDYSKIEANKLELEEIPFQIRETTDDILGLLTLKTAEKDLFFHCIIDHNIPQTLQGDPARLRQILINLTNNAIKFTKTGGIIIRVAIEHEEAEHVKLSFRVTDTGIGIPENRINRLFQSFSQVDSSTTRKFGGTGLGLAISKQLAELMGGQIGIESQLGEGSTFWFTILLRRDPGTTPPPQANLFQNCRFLIFTPPDGDRNELNLQPAGQVVREHLLSLECDLDLANSYAALNELLLEAYKDDRPYSIILADLSLLLEPCNLKANLPDFLRPKFIIALTPNKKIELTDDYDAIIPAPIKRSLFYEQLGRCMGLTTLNNDNNKKDFKDDPKIVQRRKQLKILLVDDNQVNIKVGSRMLAKLGFECATAGNGIEALAALGASHYDLVFMDIQMPEMDGYETTRQIRNQSTTTINPTVIIIAMTAHALKSDRDRCLIVGMNDFLTKPVRLEDLNEVLGKAMIKLGEREKSGHPNSETDVLVDNFEMDESLEMADFSQEEKSNSNRDTKLFDKIVFLKKIDDDLELYQELLGDFIDGSNDYFQDIRDGAQESDFEKIRLAAHSVKGSAGSIEAAQMQNAAANLEKVAKAQQMELINKAMDSMEMEFEILAEILKDEIAAIDNQI